MATVAVVAFTLPIISFAFSVVCSNTPFASTVNFFIFSSLSFIQFVAGETQSFTVSYAPDTVSCPFSITDDTICPKVFTAPVSGSDCF